MDILYVPKRPTFTTMSHSQVTGLHMSMYLQPQKFCTDAWPFLNRPSCLVGVLHCIKAPSAADFSVHLFFAMVCHVASGLEQNNVYLHGLLWHHGGSSTVGPDKKRP